MSELEIWLAQLSTPAPLLSSTVKTADHKNVGSSANDDLPPLDSFLAAIESQLPIDPQPTTTFDAAVTSIPLGSPVSFGQAIEEIPATKALSSEMRAALDQIKEWSPSDDDILPLSKKSKKAKSSPSEKKPKHRR